MEKVRYTEGKCPVDGHVLVTNGTRIRAFLCPPHFLPQCTATQQALRPQPPPPPLLSLRGVLCLPHAALDAGSQPASVACMPEWVEEGMNEYTKIGAVTMADPVTSVPRHGGSKHGAGFISSGLTSKLPGTCHRSRDRFTETTVASTSGLRPGLFPFLHRSRAGLCNQGRLPGGGGTQAEP